MLAKIDHWQFDCFELSEVSGGRPLSTLTFAIMHKMGLVPGLPGRCESVHGDPTCWLIESQVLAVITAQIKSCLSSGLNALWALNMIVACPYSYCSALMNVAPCPYFNTSILPHSCSQLSDQVKLARFLQRVEQGYLDNPYHSK